MKKLILTLTHLLITLTVFCQQTPFHGEVTIMNSLYETGKVEFVPYATVEALVEQSQSTTTGSDGYFKLYLIGVPEKTRFYFNVKKEGLDVVNIDQLEAVCGQKEAVKIYMAKPQYIADFRSKIYKVGKTSAQKALEKKQQQLLADYSAEKVNSQQNQERINQLETELAQVFDQLAKVEQFANDLADKYQRINLDDASEKYREAFRLFQEGDLAGAKNLLQNSLREAEAILYERQRIEALKKEVIERDSVQKVRTAEKMQELRLKADLHGAQYEWDSVRLCYNVLLELDSMNLDNLWEVAYFLEKQNDYQPALFLYQKMLSLPVSDNEHSILLNSLGTLFYKNNSYSEAKTSYQKALEIRSVLAEKNPDVFLPDVAMTLNNLGNLFSFNKSFIEADVTYRKALKIYRILAERYPDVFSSYVANTLNNIGVLLYTNQSFSEAENSYQEALKIQRVLGEKNPDIFLPDVANTLNNIGLLLYTNQSFSEADSAHREALKIRRTLAEKNPNAFLPDVAISLNNLGNLLFAGQFFSDAETNYQEALKIRRMLAEKYPDAFLHDVATTLNNLGNLLYSNQSFLKAETAYQEALKILKTLAEKNPDAFLPDVAMTLNNLGNLMSTNQSFSEAESAYREALKIYQAQAEKSPDAFQPDIAMTLNNLGLLLSTIQSYSEAESVYKEALKIYQHQAEKNPDAFNLDVCMTEINLAILQKNLLEKTQDVRHKSSGLELLEDAEKRLSRFPSEHPKLRDYRRSIKSGKDYFQNYQKN